MFGLNLMEIVILGLVCFGPLVALSIVAVIMVSRQKAGTPPLTCRHCGQVIVATDRFCRKCGQALG